MIDVTKLRQDFPALHQKVHDEPLVYLDNAATSHKPQAVIDAVAHYYCQDNANVHRGVHALAARSTTQYEAVREQMRVFLDAEHTSEIVFTSGATAALNLIARGFGDQWVQPGDEIWVSVADHHANLVPWQQLAQRRQAHLRYLPFDAEHGVVSITQARQVLTTRSKIVAVPHQSNVLGSVTDVAALAQAVHDVGGVLVVDGAQAVAHQAVSVRQLAADFYVLSGHKMFAPTGVGVLYGRSEWLQRMEPTQFGGEMIAVMTEQHSTWADIPWRFEAGTPHIAGVVGLGAAVSYWRTLDRVACTRHEQQVTEHILTGLSAISGVRVFGSPDAAQHHGVISFQVMGVHPHDIATALDAQGIAVRAGHHCAQPLMSYLGVPATVRASLMCYNTLAEAQALVAGVAQAKEFFVNGGFI